MAPAAEGARASADPATPVRGSAAKRKAPSSARKASEVPASPTPGVEGGRGKKKAAPKMLSEEAVEREDEDEDDGQSPAKKMKVGESEGQE